MDLSFSNVPTEDQVVVKAAAARWQQVIVGDLENATLDPDAFAPSRCGPLPPTVDDLSICAAYYEGLNREDGTHNGGGGVLGYSRPLLRRTTGKALPAAGEYLMCWLFLLDFGAVR